METLLEEALYAGCIGMSTGLAYCPRRKRLLTSVPARVFGLTNHGTIQAGAFADLVLFRPGANCRRRRLQRPHATNPGHVGRAQEQVLTLRICHRNTARDGTIDHISTIKIYYPIKIFK